MKSVPAMDVNALHALSNVWRSCNKKHIILMLSHVQEQPLKMMQKAGFDKKIGEGNLCENIDKALEKAELIGKKITANKG